MSRTSRRSITDFLAQHRIAVAGVSRNPRHFTRAIWNEFKKRGYDVVPVNPKATEIDGLPCAPSVADVHPTPEAVLVLTPASESAGVVADSARAGVHRIWFYRAVGAGAADPDAMESAARLGMDVVAGECPFMFFPKPGFPHNFHRGFRAITGTLPR